MEYKNLEITTGLDAAFIFPIQDENGLDLVMTGYTFKLEIFDVDETLVLTQSIPNQVSTGSLKFLFSRDETKSLKGPVYNYRLIIIDGTGFGKLYYQGFLSCESPIFSESQTPTNTTILPDGTLYPTGAVNVIPDIWYAISTYYRFLISGIGTLVIDGKDLRGTVFLNRGVFIATDGQNTRWIPELEGMTAFRINQVSGTPTIKYLP